jgi:putative ABC transport system substrate-binding protein
MASPRRIGVLMAYNEGNPEVQASLAAFREALAKLGWTQGKNVQFENRWVGSDLSLMQQATKALKIWPVDNAVGNVGNKGLSS